MHKDMTITYHSWMESETMVGRKLKAVHCAVLHVTINEFIAFEIWSNIKQLKRGMIKMSPNNLKV